MKPRQVIGMLLAIIATVVLAWGIRGLAGTPDCGDFGQVACPSSIGPDLGAVIGGSVAFIVSLFLAPSGFLVAGLVGGIGGLAFGLIRHDNTDIVIGLVFIGVVVFFGILGVLLNRAGAKKKARVLRIMGHGLSAEGVVTEVRDTGSSVNDDPVVLLLIDYRRSDGVMARVEHRMTVPRLNPPRPGGFVTVHYEPTGDDTIVDVPEPEAVPAPMVAGLPAELERLAVMHRAGSLTDEEFDIAKQRLLGTG